jgi:hypothetical protein
VITICLSTGSVQYNTIAATNVQHLRRFAGAKHGKTWAKAGLTSAHCASYTFLNTIDPSLARIKVTHVSTTEAGGLALIGSRQLVVAFNLTE